MKQIVLATNNNHKLSEFRQMCEPLGITILSLADLQLDVDVEETGSTFAENAAIKAEAIMQLTNLPVFADDSELEVAALNGAPGVYSARYAGVHGDDTANNEKLLVALATVPPAQRQARFVCAIAYAKPHEATQIVEGTCDGVIALSLDGKTGFGYDPLFIPEGYNESFADLGSEIKNQVSHRAKALQKVKTLF